MSVDFLYIAIYTRLFLQKIFKKIKILRFFRTERGMKVALLNQ